MAAEKLTIHRLREKDIVPLARALWETPQAQIFNRWREQQMGWRKVLVAEEAGEPVGTVSTRVMNDGMHLIALEVAPEQRNRGLGARIIAHVLQEAAREGCRRVFLDVRVDNPARRLYHRMGFRRVGKPFVNTWWLYDNEGGRERIDEMSLRMVKRVAVTSNKQQATGNK